MHFNIQRLIDDLGGAPAVARSLGICRTTPYGWVRRDFVSSTYLSKIKEAWPDLDLDAYFTEELNERDPECRPGIPRQGVGGDPNQAGHKRAAH